MKTISNLAILLNETFPGNNCWDFFKGKVYSVVAPACPYFKMLVLKNCVGIPTQLLQQIGWIIAQIILQLS